MCLYFRLLGEESLLRMSSELQGNERELLPAGSAMDYGCLWLTEEQWLAAKEAQQVRQGGADKHDINILCQNFRRQLATHSLRSFSE